VENVGIAPAISKGWGKRTETPGPGFPPFSMARHFHSAPAGSRRVPRLVQSHEQLAFRLLHTPSRFGIAVLLRCPVQRLMKSRSLRRGSRALPVGSYGTESPLSQTGQ
jgi:hypothetical protein